MKYIGLLSSAASGKMGGIVASHNRNGSYFRRHVVPVQSRTAAQRLVRNAFAAFSSAFKNLTAAQVAAWNALGTSVTLKSKLGTTYHPTGQQLFVSCNKHLAMIGITTQLSNPPTIPSIPGFTTFTATPTYAAGLVTDFGLATTPTPNSSYALQIRATATQSNGRTFVGRSKYRNIWAANPATSTIPSQLASYVTVFGPLTGQGQVGFQMRYIDPVSGFAGTPVSQLVSYTQSAAGVAYTLATVASGSWVHNVGPGILTTTVTNLGKGGISLLYSISGLPSIMVPTWTANPCAIGTPAVCTITVPTGTPLGVYTAVITATFGTYSVQTSTTITIT